MQTCSGEEVGREDTREKEEEADVMRCGVVWCGVMRCGVMRCGVVWCDEVWCGVVWCGVVWCGDKRWKGESTPRTASKHVFLFLCREILRAGSLCMCRVCVVYSETVQC